MSHYPGAVPDSLSHYTVNVETQCWEWTGYVDRNGYARAYDPDRPRNQRTQWAHRLSYEHHKGPIPTRHQIDHTCQNTTCVNPNHLDAVTAVEHAVRTMRRLGKDNRHEAAGLLRSSGLSYAEIAEALEYSCRTSAHRAVEVAIEKGLVRADEVPRPVRLSEQEREDVRDLYAMGVPQLELAAWYRIDGSAVSRICNHLETRAARSERGLAS